MSSYTIFLSGVVLVKMRKLITLFVLLTSFSLLGQEIRHKDEIGAGFGVMNYSGDLAQGFNTQNLSPSLQLFFRNNFSNNYSVLRANILLGTLKANEADLSDPLPNQRQLKFDASVVEFSVLYEYNFLNYREISGGKREDNYLSPYIFGGVGAAIMVGGTSPAYLVLPIGLGLKYQLSKNWNLGLEASVRKTFSDQLDGFADDELLNSSSKYDSYYNLSFSVSYTFYSDMCAAHYKDW